LENEWRKLEPRTIQIYREENMAVIHFDLRARTWEIRRAAALAHGEILLFTKTATRRTNRGRTQTARVCGYLFSTQGRKLSLTLLRHG